MTTTSGSTPKRPTLPAWLRRIPLSIRAAIVGAIVGAIVTALLTVAIPSFISHLRIHPDDRIVENLMQRDIYMAKTHDVSPIQSVYAYNAVVVDSGCQTNSQPTVWSGLPNITNRYESLPQIVTLDHATPQIRWIPDDSSATMAIATASTTGTVMQNGSSYELKGNELWEVTQINGQWLVTSFTFDLC